MKCLGFIKSDEIRYDNCRIEGGVVGRKRPWLVLIYRVIYSSSTIVEVLVRDIIWCRKFKLRFYRFATVFQLRHFCIGVAFITVIVKFYTETIRFDSVCQQSFLFSMKEK
jgi:hypothetical protein